MKKLYWLGLALCMVAILDGCGNASKGAGSDDVASKAAATPPGPSAPTGNNPSGDLEVDAFKGGYGIDFYEAAAKEFQAATPGLTVKVDGDPRIWEKIRPRLISGDPPSLMFPGWGFDHWAAAEEGQLMRLDDALASPSTDGKSKWGDTFEPDLLKLGQMYGKQYVLPYYFNVWGFWYNPDVFKANGWTAPTSYDELLALCEKVKAKGLAPITFQGKYPYYMLEGMFLPWVQDIGGIKALNDAQNLVPGAWKSDAMLKVASMIKELQTKGYFESGATALSHTESQTDLVNGKAAMIPCGTWLYSEMKSVMPPNTKLQFMVTPPVKGAGDPTAVPIDIEPWMVPAKGKNPNAAIAFFKYMTSLPEAQKFVLEKSTLMAIKGSDAVKLPDTLVEPSKAFKLSKTKWSYELRYWYPDMEKELENALTELLNGGTPQQFCDRAEAAAEKVRTDDSITKHKVGS